MHRLSRLAAAALVVAAAGLVGTVGVATAPPAQAAACSGSTGVTVVVDNGGLGGGVQQECASGSRASSLFEAAGFSLTYVQNQPGFVCRVAGAPSSDPCVNTPPSTAYWALFVSDGVSGTWGYASSGVSGQTVPDGGYVAFAWQTGDRRLPSVPATARRAPSPSATAAPSTATASARPTRKPTTRPSPTRATASASATRKPTSSATTATTAPTASATTSAPTATASATETASAAPSETASAAASPSEVPSTDPTSTAPSPGQTTTLSVTGEAEPASAEPATDAADGALPGWVVPVVLLALVAAGGAAYGLRRRSASTPRG